MKNDASGSQPAPRSAPVQRYAAETERGNFVVSTGLICMIMTPFLLMGALVAATSLHLVK